MCFRLIPLIVVLACVFSSDAFSQDDRWGTTATNGSGLGLGDATTVTWGFVADGTTIIPGISGESTDNSSLISFLDTNIGPGGGGSDLTNRPWHALFVDIFDRWDSVSGLQFVYEANDTGARIDGTSPPLGQLGVVADVRIGGHSIDGQTGSNTLAYNYFPDHGDMVIDTDNVAFYSDSTDNYLGLRNVLAHEFGHGMGLPHVNTSGGTNAQLMNPFVNLNFDGPQIDDIAEAQRRYGDDLEDGAGNDTTANATDQGLVVDGVAVSVGSDANQGASPAFVLPGESDFVSIDDDSDVDFFKFTLDQSFDMTFTLDMVGPSYTRNGSAYNLSRQSDLDLAIFASDGTTMLGQSNTTGLDLTETINLFLNAGTYYAQITGRNNDAQFYEYTFLGVAAVPEPGSLLALGWLGTVFVSRRRRRI